MGGHAFVLVHDLLAFLGDTHDVITSLALRFLANFREHLLSDRDETSRPGSASCLRTQAGAKDKLGSISKQGDRYLRSLFTAGALAVIRYAKIHGTGHRPWLTRLLARRPTKVAAIALANKIARMAWAMMARDDRYREPVALAA